MDNNAFYSDKGDSETYHMYTKQSQSRQSMAVAVHRPGFQNGIPILRQTGGPPEQYSSHTGGTPWKLCTNGMSWTRIPSPSNKKRRPAREAIDHDTHQATPSQLSMTHRDARPDSATLGVTLRGEYVFIQPAGPGSSGDESRRHRHRHHDHAPSRHGHGDNARSRRPRPRHRHRQARPAAVPAPDDSSSSASPPTSKQVLMAYLNRPLPPLPPGRSAYAAPRTAPPRPAFPPHHPWQAATPFENPRAAPPPPPPVPQRRFHFVSPDRGGGEEEEEEEGLARRGRPREPRHRRRAPPPPTPTHSHSAPVSAGLSSRWSDDSSDEEAQPPPPPPQQQQQQRRHGGGEHTAVRRAVRRASESMVGAVRRVGSFASRASSRSRSRRRSGSRRGSRESPSVTSSGASAHYDDHHHHHHYRGSANDRTRNLLSAVRRRFNSGARSSH